MEAAGSLDELAAAAAALPATAVELVDARLPGMRTASLLAAVREALVGRLVELVGDGACTWLILGSTARREPLPSSDLDTAIAWESDSAEGRTRSRDHARLHAHRVLDELGRCGLRRCPVGANATDPRFSRSVADWVRASRSWQEHPADEDPMVLTALLADARPIIGSAAGRVLRHERPSHELLAAMLQSATSRKPPTGFVRDFVVEHTGEHRGELDLKRGGLGPVAALGQWIAVVTGDSRGSTPERLQRGHEVQILTKDEADSLEGAFLMFFGLLLDSDAAALRAGSTPSRYVNPATVDPLTRRHLRSAFREVSRVQSHLESTWTSRLAGRIR
ncbi:MAG TPA: putative nucleotidyltransferase substrate binding domain-containing protein [Pseudonocardia sp.]